MQKNANPIKQTPPPSNTIISFVAPNVPPLEDGDYTVEMSHTLTLSDPKPNDPPSVTFNKSYSLYVKGERFSINPKEFQKVFPPDKTQGDYDTVLPHVVLKRRTLPWERLVTDNAVGSSWLAILVYTTDQSPPVVKRTLADLYPNTTADGNGTLAQGIYSYGSIASYNSKTYFLEPGEQSTDICLCIDLTPQLFSNAPSLVDLAWVGHGRHKVDTSKNVDEDFAVVVGTSMPTPGKSSVAYLVTLEGLGDQLPQDDGSFKTQPTWNAIRLVVLKQWNFQTLPLQMSFEKMLENLNGATNSANVENNDSQLRLPDNYTPAAYVPPATPLNSPTPFDSGYTVLSDNLPTSKGASWYRGPLIPSILNSNPTSSIKLPVNRAYELDITVPITPTLDRSYSSAWQLGRLIALADKNFAVAQASWKRNCRLQLNTLIRQSLPVGGNSKPDYVAALKSALKTPATLQSYLGNTLFTDTSVSKTGLSIPQNLIDWLAQLALLKNVPFDYLAPDHSMLPDESIKFVTIDQCWIAALLDGAWSLERQPGSCFDSVYQPWSQIQNSTLKPSFTPTGVNTFWAVSGALLNSKIIPGYAPGIYFNPDSGVNILSDVQVGANTVLVLFDSATITLTIHEPPEGIHFGFEMNAQYGFTKTLKYIEIGSTFYPAGGVDPVMGQDVPSTGTGAVAPVTVPLRPTAGNVVQFNQLAIALSAASQIPIQTTTPVVPPAMTPAEFSFELTQSVQSVCFTLPVNS